MSDDLSVLRALADALRRSEASTRAEGIDPDDNPAYLLVKARLLSGELKLSEAHSIYEACFPSVITEVIPMPLDGKRNALSSHKA